MSGKYITIAIICFVFEKLYYKKMLTFLWWILTFSTEDFFLKIIHIKEILHSKLHKTSKKIVKLHSNMVGIISKVRKLTRWKLADVVSYSNQHSGSFQMITLLNMNLKLIKN